MNYKIIIALFMVIMVSACALEKEDSDTLYGVYSYTIASAVIDNITDKITQDNKITFNIEYTLSSNGKFGDDTDSEIKKSYIEISSAKIYLYQGQNQIQSFDMNTIKPNDRLMYNTSKKDNETITLDKKLEKGEYIFSIIIQGREKSGKGTSTINNEFGGEFGISISNTFYD